MIGRRLFEFSNAKGQRVGVLTSGRVDIEHSDGGDVFLHCHRSSSYMGEHESEYCVVDGPETFHVFGPFHSLDNVVRVAP